MNMEEFKERVLSFVRRNGPVLPVQVSKLIERDILTASAVLSELVSKKLIMLSSGKIGSSPLYYVKGQEAKLQVLYDKLAMKEKEAYNLLKEKKVIRDKTAEPSIRVALRAIRDFAIPLKVNLQSGEEIFWKWYLTGDEEVSALIRKIVKLPEKKIAKPEKKVVEEKVEKPKKMDEFAEKIYAYLRESSIKVLDKKIIRKNREIEMVVKVPSSLGTLDFFLKAKNKKRVSEADLSLAFSKGQSNKLPVLFVSTGELTKKGKKHIEGLRGYLRFKHIV